MKQVILIDGNSLMYRSYHATGRLGIKTSSGFVTNAIYTFINSLNSFLKDKEYDYLLVAFDAGKKTFRHELADDYKAGRAKTPDEFILQIPYIKRYLDLAGLPRYEQSGIEADDIIGTCAAHFSKLNYAVSIYSGDKDLLQLVDNNTTVFLTKKGLSDLDEYNHLNFYEKMNLTPLQIIDFKAIAGDSSDNLKGVSGFGAQSAISALNQYNTLEGLYDHLSDFTPHKQKLLLASKEEAFLCKQLATILTDAKLEQDFNTFVKKEQDLESLIALYQELEFDSLLEELDIKPDLKNYDYQVLKSEEEFRSVLAPKSFLYIEHFEFNYHRYNPIGLAYLPLGSSTAYILPLELIMTSTFKEYVESQDFEIYTADVKRLIVSLAKYNLNITNVTFDLLLAIYVLDPDSDTSSFPTAISYFSRHLILKDEDVYNKGKKKSLPSDDVLFQHLANKVSLIAEYKDRSLELLKQNDQLDLFSNIELPLSFCLASMEMNGVLVSKKELEAQSDKISKMIFELDEQIYDLVGKFNLNSPKQLKEVLFDKLNLTLPKGKKPSTDASVLEYFVDQHPVIPLILEHRKLTKLLSSYITNTLSHIFPDGKIHTIFQQTLTRTGRLSSVEPNLQNLPARSDLQKELRKAYIASPNTSFYSFDYSQIELRVLAEIADVKHFKTAFANSLDVHTETAKQIFNKDDITSLERQKAKACNFGIVYGIGAFGLASDLGISVPSAKEFINHYFLINPEIKTYQETALASCTELGYAKSLFARRRYIDLKNGTFFEKENNKRIAINTPIQSTAADIIKMAMINIHHELKTNNYKSRLIIQIHDELIFEIYDDELEAVKELILRNMLNIKGFNLKLEVSESSGKDLFSI